MKQQFTAVMKKEGKWWIGWVAEVSGVNSQGATKKELMENLASALSELMQLNREEAIREAGTGYSEEVLAV
jgi:predicted RNase H-like HicB family nuclease